MPMRHSSERVPGKNYRDFNGKPLFHHMLETLLETKSVERVVVNTDSNLIIGECARHFPEVTCLRRPEELLGGDIPMTDILAYDAQQVESDWYLQTHSTNPLLSSAIIEAAIAQLDECIDRNDSLFSVTRLQTRLYDCTGRPLNHDPRVLLRTQDLDPIFEENSNIYIFQRRHILAGQRFGDHPLLFPIAALDAIDIDVEEDFQIAEILHRNRVEQR